MLVYICSLKVIIERRNIEIQRFSTGLNTVVQILNICRFRYALRKKVGYLNHIRYYFISANLKNMTLNHDRC